MLNISSSLGRTFTSYNALSEASPDPVPGELSLPKSVEDLLAVKTIIKAIGAKGVAAMKQIWEVLKKENAQCVAMLIFIELCKEGVSALSVAMPQSAELADLRRILAELEADAFGICGGPPPTNLQDYARRVINEAIGRSASTNKVAIDLGDPILNGKVDPVTGKPRSLKDFFGDDFAREAVYPLTTSKAFGRALSQPEIGQWPNTLSRNFRQNTPTTSAA